MIHHLVTVISDKIPMLSVPIAHLIWTLENLGTQPEKALAGLVANVWDAGVYQIDIFVRIGKKDRNIKSHL